MLWTDLVVFTVPLSTKVVPYGGTARPPNV